MTNPLLLCLSPDKIAGIIQKLDDYQKQKHGVRFNKPAYINNNSEPVVINAPDYEELEAMEIEKEIKKTPKHQEKVP